MKLDKQFGRFKIPSETEVLQTLIEKILMILIFNQKNPSFFEENVFFAGNNIAYANPVIDSISNLFFKPSFTDNLTPLEQYQTIVAEIEKTGLLAKKLVPEQNQWVVRFVWAIKYKSYVELNSIFEEIKERTNTQKILIKNKLEDVLSQPVTRLNCLYRKEQAFTAAALLLEVIDDNPKTTISSAQKTIAITNLADTIWYIFRDPLKNFSPNHIWINFLDSFVLETLKAANIHCEDLNKFENYFIGINTFGSIHLKTPNSLMPYACDSLPSDETIHLRDALSTIAKGHAKNPNIANIYSLPKEIFREVMLFAKPSKMAIADIDKEMAWNKKRLS